MTKDERPGKLVERHQALTQTVELMARGIDGLKCSIEGVKSYTNDIAEPTARLLHIARIREHRIARLEGGSSSANNQLVACRNRQRTTDNRPPNLRTKHVSLESI